MKNDLRLPQNNTEGLIYGSVICGTTVLLMASFNIYIQFQEVSLALVGMILKAFPVFFVIAMLLEKFAVSHFAHKMAAKYGDKKDSFNAQVLFSVIFTVVGMSCVMTLIGDVVGHGFRLESGIIARYFTALPRNFSIVLLIELLLAQPLARNVMVRLHR